MVASLHSSCRLKIQLARLAVRKAQLAVANELAKAKDHTEFAHRCHEIDSHLSQALEALDAADHSAREHMKDPDDDTA